MNIKVIDYCGDFAENKDTARAIREKMSPAFYSGEGKIVLDFTGVDSSTQSFVHALISSFFHNKGEEALEIFEFKGCTKAVKSLITTVINYSLE